MRIIAGEHRGRKLLGPIDQQTTRPITDRVKTSVFDRLMHGGWIDGARVLDVFSGTGSMGIECLSRGAAHVTFVERDRVALKRLRANLEAIGAGDAVRVIAGDALSRALVSGLGDEKLDLVFFDPPYRMVEEAKTAERVYRQMTALAEVCDDEALLVFRTSTKVAQRAIEGWKSPRVDRRGGMLVWWFERH